MLRVCAIALALLLPLGASAQEFSSLEERMSAAEFKSAGLEKLSDAELQALNNWIRGQRALVPAGSTVAAMPVEDRRGLTEQVDFNDPIVSRILGEFRGWRGSDTVFELENGQVWKSTDPAARLAVKLNNPTVTLTPGMMNSWFLKVEGYNSKVRVMRLK